MVTNFDTAVKLIADNESYQTKIVRLKLRLKSNTNHPIKIALISGDQLVQEIFLQVGDTTTTLVDWYSNYAELTFTSNHSINGSIQIEYKFIGL